MKQQNDGIVLTARDIILGALEKPLLRGIPCLLGPSGGGKTWLGQEIHEERHPDGVLVTVIPAQESSDELGGIPLRPTEANQSVLWSLPVAIPQELLDKGGTIFVDEVDKTAPDVWPILLQMTDHRRRLRSTPIPPNVDIVFAANQPEIPLPDVLVSRLLWIRYPEPEDTDMASHADLRVVPPTITTRLQTRVDKLVKETAFPPIVPSRRAAHRLASWLQWGPFWEATEQSRARVLMGILPQEMIAETLAALTKPVINTVEMCQQFVERCTPAELDAAFLDIFFSLPVEAVLPFFDAIDSRAAMDNTDEFERIWNKAQSIEVRVALNCPEAQPTARKWWLEQNANNEASPGR